MSSVVHQVTFSPREPKAADRPNEVTASNNPNPSVTRPPVREVALVGNTSAETFLLRSLFGFRTTLIGLPIFAAASVAQSYFQK